MTENIESLIQKQRLRFFDPIFSINNNSKKTIIIFQGCSSGLTQKYDPYNLETVDNKLPWLMKNTFENIKTNNYIFVNDFFQLYYLLNFNDIFDSLKEQLRLFNTNENISLGISAGGYGSILFGNLFKFKKIIAINPQISLKLDNTYIYKNNYRKILYTKYKENIKYDNLKRIQPFSSPTVCFYCKKENFDKKQIDILDKNDSNLTIKPLGCKTHFYEGNKKDLVNLILTEIEK